MPVTPHAFRPEPRTEGSMSFHSPKRPRAAVLSLVLVAALAGCGQKGALYLPGKPQPVQPQPEPTPPAPDTAPPNTAPPTAPDDGGQ